MGSARSRRFADRAYGPIVKTAKIFTTRRPHLLTFRPGSAEQHSEDQDNDRAPVADWATDFDHLDPRWVEDPPSIWRELRQTRPVAHTGRFEGVYLPSRYEDIRAVAYDTEHFSSRRIAVREGKELLPPSPPITSDPPAHRDDRRILLPPFTPQPVAKLEPRVNNLSHASSIGTANEQD